MVKWEFLEDSKLRDHFKKIVEYCEKAEAEKRPWRDFEASDVGVPPWVLRKLVYDYEALKVTYKSSSHTCYWLACEVGEARKTLDAYALAREIPKSEGEKLVEIPSDFLDVVVGYDDLKELIVGSLKADRPVHILLVGPPATAKSLMLYEIERLQGSEFVLGGTASRAGIRDVIVEKRPRILIIDEIDKISDVNDLSTLLTWMETGRATVTVHGKHVDVKGKGWVFAAANRLDAIRRKAPELLSRFVVVNLKEYDRNTYIDVVKNVLIRREGTDPELADYIARKTVDLTQDPRVAVYVARLSKSRGDVDRYVEIIRKYGRSP